MSTERRFSPRAARRQRGLTLIELSIAIVVLGIAVAAVISVYSQAVRTSVEPLVRKQAVAVAESLLTEVLMHPFTYCDPQDPANDPNSPPASNAACTLDEDNGGGALGPMPSTETRYSSANPFDNVADYNGFAMGPGIKSLDDGSVAVPGLDAYSAQVTVSRAGAVFGLADAEVLRVDVLVSGRGESVTLTGYRFRYAPNATG